MSKDDLATFCAGRSSSQKFPCISSGNSVVKHRKQMHVSLSFRWPLSISNLQPILGMAAKGHWFWSYNNFQFSEDIFYTHNLKHIAGHLFHGDWESPLLRISLQLLTVAIFRMQSLRVSRDTYTTTRYIRFYNEHYIRVCLWNVLVPKLEAIASAIGITLLMCSPYAPTAWGGILPLRSLY